MSASSWKSSGSVPCRQSVKEMSACLQRTRRYQEVRREKERVQQRLEILQRSQGGPQEGEEFIGESQAIQSTRALIARVARAEQTTVLITGESGTGKELVARAIHRQSARESGPFVSINCAAISENLLESELFGHEKGAFTDAREQKKGIFELAEGGTVFLDEIGDMSFSAQAKILRVLEERRIRRVGGNREIAVDVRLISATNQDLQARISAGRFRQDLYFRLNVFTLPLSPLRERGDDVLLLAYHFLQQYIREFRKEITAIDPAAQEVLRRYRFPGNVRELRNVIERAIILCEGSSLRVEDFQVSLPEEGKSVALQEDALDSVEFPQTVKELRQLMEQVIAAHESSGPKIRDVRISATEKGGPIVPEEGTLDLTELEKRAVQAALHRAHSKKVEAASYLGITLNALNRRIRKYGIRIE